MIDIRLLVQFVAVAETLSFSAAARRLAMPQPRVSLQIRKLETYLGSPLFERNTRRVELTAHGRELLETVTPLVRSIETTLGDVEARRLGMAGRLGIGLLALGEPDKLFGTICAHFARRHPDIELVAEAGPPQGHVARLRNGQLDLAVLLDIDEQPDLELHRLHPLQFAVMTHRADPLASRHALRIGDLRGRTVAMIARSHAPHFFGRYFQPLVDAGAKPLFVPELRRSLLRDSPDLVVTTVVSAPAETELRYGLVRRAVADAPPLWLTLARRNSVTHSQASQQFWLFCKRYRLGRATDEDQAAACALTAPLSDEPGIPRPTLPAPP